MSQTIVFTIADRSGTEAETSVRVTSGLNVNHYQGFAVAFANALNNFIYGKILRAVCYVFPTLAGLVGNVATSSSDVEHVGKFEFLTASGERVKCNIPCLAEAAILAYDSDDLNQAEPEVAALIAAMETGIAVFGGTISPCDAGGSDIVDTIFAREAFRNSGSRR